jgi:hypothetical protein
MVVIGKIGLRVSSGNSPCMEALPRKARNYHTVAQCQ